MYEADDRLSGREIDPSQTKGTVSLIKVAGGTSKPMDASVRAYSLVLKACGAYPVPPNEQGRRQAGKPCPRRRVEEGRGGPWLSGGFRGALAALCAVMNREEVIIIRATSRLQGQVIKRICGRTALRSITSPH